MDELVTTRCTAHIAHIRLNRPKALNALNLTMIGQLRKELERAANDINIKMVFLDGAGDRAFCSGGDVKSIAKSIPHDPDLAKTMASDFFSGEYSLDLYIHNFNKPIVIWGSGIVMGGGMGLAMGGTHRIATENSLWAMPEISIGFFPDVGACWFLNRLPIFLSRFIALTGARLDSRDLIDLGICQFSLKNSAKESIFNEMVQLNSPDPDCINAVLRKYNEEYQSSEILKHFGDIIQIFSASRLDEIFANIEKLNPQSDWLNTHLARLKTGSMLSAAVTLEYLRRTSRKSLNQVFDHDYQLATTMTQQSDFYEGVRALLIDKDQHPVWKFERPSEELNNYVHKLFTNLPPMTKISNAD